MKILILEDCFTSRKVLSKTLSGFGRCDFAVSTREAVEGFKNPCHCGAYDLKGLQHLCECNDYNLIFLNVSNPQKDDHQTLKQIRQIEKEKGKHGLDRVKIIITSAINDYSHIKTAFREQCDAYLVKQINKEKLFKKLKELELIKGHCERSEAIQKND